MHNLAVNLERNAQLFSNKDAIRLGETAISYSKLDEMASTVASNIVALGLKPGDKIALSCPNLPFFPIVYYGILKAGCVVVPLNVLFKAREIAYHLTDSDAKAYFCFEGTQELPIGQFGREAFAQTDTCENFVSMSIPGNDVAVNSEHSLNNWLSKPQGHFSSITRNGDDTAVILYTSGTTGFPKGAELSHTNMQTNAMSSQYLMRLEHKDTAMATLPLFHSFGQTVMMNASILTGASLILIPKFDPDTVISQIVEHKVSVFAGIPTMYIALFSASEHSPELSDRVKQSLRLGVSGGSSMPVEVIRQFEGRFEIPILEGYGLSETAPVATFNHLDGERIAGSVGQPLCGHMVKIVDNDGNPVDVGNLGEISVKSPSVMKGYYKRPEQTAQVMQDGWFLTGDIGRVDDHGNVFIVDRVKEVIIRGGYNIYPREVEEVMMCHPALEMVAVVGEDDSRLGEEVHAYIVLNSDTEIDSQALIAWCREQLADYKCPRHIHVRKTLPMTATGKILKRELKGTAEQEVS